jgi:hypothetical protein
LEIWQGKGENQPITGGEAKYLFVLLKKAKKIFDRFTKQDVELSAGGIHDCIQ